LELASHYQDAVDAGISEGLSVEEASAKALGALGDAKAARALFQQEYPLEMPWDELDQFPGKPAGHPYGYLSGNELVPCSREEMIKRCTNYAAQGLGGLERVWTPETDRVVRSECVPYLLEAMKQSSIKYARRELWHSLPYAILFIVLMVGAKLKPKWGGDFWAADMEPTMEMFLISMLFCWLGQSYFALRLLAVMRHATAESLVRERDIGAFHYWACEKAWNGLKVNRFTLALFGTWVLVAYGQFFSWVVHEDYSISINRAGLLQSAVFNGQWWRFATAIHITTDGLAMIPTIVVLLFYGSLTEGFFKRGFVPIIFFVSATTGLLVGLTAQTATSGMTAGALGLLGFLVVTARKDYRLQRLRSVTGFPVVITFYAIAGICFFGALDTMINLAGFGAGAVLAWLFSRRIASLAEERWFRFAGMVSAIYLIVSAVLTCVVIFITEIFGISLRL
jgi:hypothetical protein